MASKKDMRREDLIVPFIEPEKENKENMSATLSQTMPMAAMFMRNKMIGWAAVVFAIQSWLAEAPAATPTASSSGTSSGIFSVGMSFMSLAVAYMPLFLPSPDAKPTATGSQAAIPLPK